MIRWMLAVGVCCASSALAEGPTAREVLERTQAAYAAMETYQSEGTVRAALTANRTIDTTFSIRLKRPDRFLISWVQTLPGGFQQSMRGAAWNDGTGSYLYFGMLGAYAPMPSSLMALSAATGVSGGSAASITPFFIDEFSEITGSLTERINNAVLVGEEVVDGAACHVISGDTWGFRMVLWITKETYRIVKMQREMEQAEEADVVDEFSDEEVRESLNDLGMEDTPENRERVVRVMSRARGTRAHEAMAGFKSVETHTAISSPELTDADFRFDLPEGTERRDQLFPGVPGMGGE